MNNSKKYLYYNKMWSEDFFKYILFVFEISDYLNINKNWEFDFN